MIKSKIKPFRTKGASAAERLEAKAENDLRRIRKRRKGDKL